MKAESHQQLVHAAIKILCTEPLATMERIAEASNVSRMTLFRVFKSRQKLIDTLTVESYEVCNKIVSNNYASQLSTKNKIEQNIKELIPVGAMFRFLYYIPWRSQNIAVQKSEEILYQKWRCLLEELKSEGGFRPEIPTGWAVRALDSLILAAWDAVDVGEIAPKAAHEHVLEIFFNGVLYSQG